jgi:hypothetical protein
MVIARCKQMLKPGRKPQPQGITNAELQFAQTSN